MWKTSSVELCRVCKQLLYPVIKLHRVWDSDGKALCRRPVELGCAWEACRSWAPSIILGFFQTISIHLQCLVGTTLFVLMSNKTFKKHWKVKQTLRARVLKKLNKMLSLHQAVFPSKRTHLKIFCTSSEIRFLCLIGFFFYQDAILEASMFYFHLDSWFVVNSW